MWFERIIIALFLLLGMTSDALTSHFFYLMLYREIGASSQIAMLCVRRRHWCC